MHARTALGAIVVVLCLALGAPGIRPHEDIGIANATSLAEILGINSGHVYEAGASSLNWHWEDAWSPAALRCCLLLGAIGPVCAAAGIGGGAIIAPMIAYVAGLKWDVVVPISNATIFIGAVSIVIMSKAMPSSFGFENFVINFQACRVLLPASFFGTVVGCEMRALVHGRAAALLLATLLAGLTGILLRKAYTEYRLENVEQTGTRNQQPQEQGDPIADSKGKGCGPSATADHCSLDDVLPIGLSFCLVTIGRLTWYQTTSPLFPGLALDQQKAGLILSVVCLLFVVVVVVSNLHLMMHKGWSIASISFFTLVATCTGILTTVVGIGGGIVFAPFLALSIRDPAVAVATSTICHLSTSASATLQYLITQRMHVPLALLLGSVNIVASCAGFCGAQQLRAFLGGRRSIILAAIAFAVGLSAVLSGADAIERSG